MLVLVLVLVIVIVIVIDVLIAVRVFDHEKLDGQEHDYEYEHEHEHEHENHPPGIKDLPARLTGCTPSREEIGSGPHIARGNVNGVGFLFRAAAPKRIPTPFTARAAGRGGMFRYNLEALTN